MARALIVCGSTTGNTETDASYVGAALQKQGRQTTLKNAAEVAGNV